MNTPAKLSFSKQSRINDWSCMHTKWLKPDFDILFISKYAGKNLIEINLLPLNNLGHFYNMNFKHIENPYKNY